MNLWHRVYERLRQATDGPPGPHADPVRAIEFVDALCGKVVELFSVIHGIPVNGDHRRRIGGLLADRKAMRRALVGKAFDAGLQGRSEAEELVLDWPYDPRDHDADEPKVEADLLIEAALAEKPKVQAPAAKRLVSLH